MDPSLSTWVIFILGVFFCLFSLPVQSQGNVNSPNLQPPPPPESEKSPPPPPPPPPPKIKSSEKEHSHHPQDHRKSNVKLSPPQKETKLNWGKRLGLMFVGIAAILQICVVAFIIIKRRQLLKAHSGF
ncbi:hypothetical protein AABB24_006929 [Solanum stoloniferum]|uniref:Uncharacterized protein n=1 Tax=Solanum stoloniferum TaxID=62892 RepID=A0ABD2V3H3_9SOLN